MSKLSEIVREKLEKAKIKPANCRSCGMEIFFIRTSSGKLMPMQLDLSPHWNNCTNPQQFRKKDDEKKAERSEEPEPDMDDLPI